MVSVSKFANMKFILVICLVAFTLVSAEFPITKEYGGKNTVNILGTSITIVTDKYFMVYTNSNGIEVNMVYDSENTVGETTTTYKAKILNKKLGGIKNNDVIASQLTFLGCAIPKVSVISYTWLENNCKDLLDDYGFKNIPQTLTLGKKQESDSVAYEIKYQELTDIQYKLGRNNELNNEVENTLKPDASNTLIPGLMVLIITLGLLLF